MQMTVSCDGSIAISHEELKMLLDQTQPGDLVILKVPMEDSWPLHSDLRGYIVRDEDRTRIAVKIPVSLDTFEQFMKSDK
jgi:hypothetical protein